MRARAWYATVAIVTAVALAIQVVIAVRAPGTPRGHGVGELAGGSLATRIVRVFSFFTIRSNVLSAVVAGQMAYTLAHGAASSWYPDPFVDVTTHGYGRVLVNAVLVGFVCVVVGSLLAVADRQLPAT